MKTFIIAEAGVNHNGNLNLAKKLIDVAKAAGADAVKFQTFQADLIVTTEAKKAEYQSKNTGVANSQYLMLKELELSERIHRELSKYCRIKKIMFLSTPFDLPSINLLHKLNMPIFKIPSGEITNLPYLRAIAKYKKPIIMSTGMATLSEVRAAVRVLLKNGQPRNKIKLLHCTTEYPTPYTDVNLKAMCTLKTELKLPVGYSDHTLGIEVSIAAVALGAEIIEKHFTLDRSMSGPDHKASLEPAELTMLVQAIRNTEKSLGNGLKRPSYSELKNIKVVRKSIVASRLIYSGELFTTKNLTVKRPGTGLSPMNWDKVIGHKAKKDFARDELICL